MTDCCNDKSCEIEKLQQTQSRTLNTVLAINGGMFVVEFAAGLLIASTALLADSLDMLGDALIYALSLYVVARNAGWKAIAALVKSAAMAIFGLFVVGQALYKLYHPVMPEIGLMALTGMLAMAANAICLALLWKHRADDVNMRSVWLCSRNDIIANLSVIFASVGVWSANSQWPDLIIGLGIAGLFLHSAYNVSRDALGTWKQYKNHQIPST